MQLRFRSLMLAGHLVVLVALLLGGWLLLVRGLRADLLAAVGEEVRRELRVSAEVLSRVGPEELDPDSIARLLTEHLGHRVTVLRADGRVLADSYVGPGRSVPAAEVGEREEVVGALERGEAVAAGPRLSLGEPFLFGARRLVSGGDTLVLRIGVPVARLERRVRRRAGGLVALGLGGLLLSLLLVGVQAGVLRGRVRALRDRILAMSAGESRRRPPPGPAGEGLRELQPVALALDRLSEELEGWSEGLRRERDEMEALVDCMAEGVVALTEDARILRTNRSARELMGVAEVPALAPVGAVVRRPELREILEEAVRREVPARELRLGDRRVIVSGRSVEGGGAVVPLLDVTELRRLEAVRRDFVANASHELKTPLTTLRGFAETLLEDDPPPEIRREFLGHIRAGAVRLQHLVDDLLDLSRLESGAWAPALEGVEVAELARSVWEELTAGRERPGVAFRVEGSARARADRAA